MAEYKPAGRLHYPETGELVSLSFDESTFVRPLLWFCAFKFNDRPTLLGTFAYFLSLKVHAFVFQVLLAWSMIVSKPWYAGLLYQAGFNYSTITLVLAISIFQFLFPWIDKSKIRPCDDFSNTLKKFAMKSFSLISSICGKSENFAMTQLPGGQYCHQVIYWPW